MKAGRGILKKFYESIGKTLIVLVTALLVAAPTTWFVMIALGILHHRWEQIPAFGYWETYVLLAAINVVGSAVKTGIKPAATTEKK